MSSMPGNGGTEQTTTVIIGTGLSGLAVASRAPAAGRGLHRRGRAGHLARDAARQHHLPAALRRARIPPRSRSATRSCGTCATTPPATTLDIRNSTRAVQLTQVGPGTPESQPSPQWAVHTPDGVLVADHIVLTRCAHSQLRRMLTDFGIAVGQNLAAAMRAIGIYLVGVGELITPTPKEVLRQAKAVGQAISAKVYPDSVPSSADGKLRGHAALLAACRDAPGRQQAPAAGLLLAVRFLVGAAGRGGAWPALPSATSSPSATTGEDDDAPRERLPSVRFGRRCGSGLGGARRRDGTAVVVPAPPSGCRRRPLRPPRRP